MDELDQNARNLIRLARAQERPPSRAIRWRVQRGVAIAAPTAALLSGSISTAAAKGAMASMGALGLKASFIFGIACGVGVTSVGYGIAGYRHASSAHHESVKIAVGSSNLRRSAEKHEHAPTVPAGSVAAAPLEEPSSLEPEPSEAPALTNNNPFAPARATTQRPNKSHGLAEAKSASESTKVQAVQRVPTLAPEINLLTEVQSQLRNGHAASALASLRRDDGRFAQSPLRPDLDAVRIITLCELGRDEEARRAKVEFLQTYPGSPLEQRVRHACSEGVSPGRQAPESSMHARSLGKP